VKTRSTTGARATFTGWELATADTLYVGEGLRIGGGGALMPMFWAMVIAVVGALLSPSRSLGSAPVDHSCHRGILAGVDRVGPRRGSDIPHRFLARRGVVRGGGLGRPSVEVRTEGQEGSEGSP
jgi:hypothetical protein